MTYDGPDLADVAELTGLSEREVVEAHTGSTWRVAFGGFAPGFGYLVGGDPRLEVPRRESSRTKVPAGAVGLAGTFSGVYPRESPGGWQLIGTTKEPMWDLDRDPPALLAPGAVVTFVEEGSITRRNAPCAHSGQLRGDLRLRSARPVSRTWDAPAPPASAWAAPVPPTAAALRQANRAVGNAEDAAAIEVTFGGLEVEVNGGHVWLCVTGAPTPVSVDGRGVGAYTVVSAPSGSVVRLGVPQHGLRSYVAVRGGIDVPPVLGSRSHDVMAGLGPPPLSKGDELPVGAASEAFPEVDVLPPPRLDDEVVLSLVRGPRDEWVEDVDTLVRTEWTASEKTNRVGMRLEGAAVEHRDGETQLPSEGAYRGAVQVPPSGEPVVFLADHPVTGGYPVVAVVVDADVDRAAQVRPGQKLRFRWVS